MPDKTILKEGDVGEIVIGPLNVRLEPGKTKRNTVFGTANVGDRFLVEELRVFSEVLIFAFVEFENKQIGNPEKGWIAIREGKINYAIPTEKEQLP